MSLRHLYKDINSLGIYPDLIHGHLPLSGAQHVKMDNTIHKNKYYGYKIRITNCSIAKYPMIDIEPEIRIIKIHRIISCNTRNGDCIKITGIGAKETFNVNINGKGTNMIIDGMTLDVIYDKYFTLNGTDVVCPLDIIDKMKQYTTVIHL